jgi:hypothetical protein
MRIVLRGGAMIYTLENKADVLLGQGKWHAIRYYSSEEANGSLTLAVTVVKKCE